MKRSEVFSQITGGRLSPAKEIGQAWAPSNIALVKYWCKRDAELNLPQTSSLSVSLGHLGTRTEIALSTSDEFYLNGSNMNNTPFARRLSSYLDCFRPGPYAGFKVKTENNFPTAAGLASSASGFAALVLALNDLFGWDLDKRELSILARIGSGSAARSIYSGFVQWHRGQRDDGMDSFAEPLKATWPDLRIGVVTVTKSAKKTGSTEGMTRTLQTSELYKSWPQKVEQDLAAIKKAIANKDFALLGQTAESNALTMHATMLGAWPPLLYWQPETVALLHKVWRLRRQGTPVYFTIDAGPNVKMLLLQSSASDITKEFGDIQRIEPFSDDGSSPHHK